MARCFSRTSTRISRKCYISALIEYAEVTVRDFFCSCVSVGTRKGYSINNCDPFGRVYTKSESRTYTHIHVWLLTSFTSIAIDDGAKGIVEMLFCTSLIALVGAADQPQSSPRKLQIVNTKVTTHHFTFLASIQEVPFCSCH